MPQPNQGADFAWDEIYKKYDLSKCYNYYVQMTEGDGKSTYGGIFETPTWLTMPPNAVGIPLLKRFGDPLPEVEEASSVGLLPLALYLVSRDIRQGSGSAHSRRVLSIAAHNFFDPIIGANSTSISLTGNTLEFSLDVGVGAMEVQSVGVHAYQLAARENPDGFQAPLIVDDHLSAEDPYYAEIQATTAGKITAGRKIKVVSYPGEGEFAGCTFRIYLTYGPTGTKGHNHAFVFFAAIEGIHPKTGRLWKEELSRNFLHLRKTDNGRYLLFKGENRAELLWDGTGPRLIGPSTPFSIEPYPISDCPDVILMKDPQNQLFQLSRFPNGEVQLGDDVQTQPIKNRDYLEFERNGRRYAIVQNGERKVREGALPNGRGTTWLDTPKHRYTVYSDDITLIDDHRGDYFAVVRRDGQMMILPLHSETFRRIQHDVASRSTPKSVIPEEKVRPAVDADLRPVKAPHPQGPLEGLIEIADWERQVSLTIRGPMRVSEGRGSFDWERASGSIDDLSGASRSLTLHHLPPNTVVIPELDMVYHVGIGEAIEVDGAVMAEVSAQSHRVPHRAIDSRALPLLVDDTWIPEEKLGEAIPEVELPVPSDQPERVLPKTPAPPLAPEIRLWISKPGEPIIPKDLELISDPKVWADAARTLHVEPYRRIPIVLRAGDVEVMIRIELNSQKKLGIVEERVAVKTHRQLFKGRVVAKKNAQGGMHYLFKDPSGNASYQFHLYSRGIVLNTTHCSDYLGGSSSAHEKWEKMFAPPVSPSAKNEAKAPTTDALPVKAPISATPQAGEPTTITVSIPPHLLSWMGKNTTRQFERGPTSSVAPSVSSTRPQTPISKSFPPDDLGVSASAESNILWGSGSAKSFVIGQATSLLPAIAAGMMSEWLLGQGEAASGITLSEPVHEASGLLAVAEAGHRTHAWVKEITAGWQVMRQAQASGLAKAGMIAATQTAIEKTSAQSSRILSYTGFVRGLPGFEIGALAAEKILESMGIDKGSWGHLGVSIAGGITAGTFYEMGVVAAGWVEYAVPVGWIYLFGKANLWIGEMQEEEKRSSRMDAEKALIAQLAVKAVNGRLAQAGSPLRYDYDRLRLLLEEWGNFSAGDGVCHRSAHQEMGHQILRDVSRAVQNDLKKSKELTPEKLREWREEFRGGLYNTIESYPEIEAQIAFAVMIEIILGQEALHQSHRVMITTDGARQKKLADQFRSHFMGQNGQFLSRSE